MAEETELLSEKRIDLYLVDGAKKRRKRRMKRVAA
jgi:hypothetical protein